MKLYKETYKEEIQMKTSKRSLIDKIIIAVLLCIFCYSAFRFFTSYREYKEGIEIYEEAGKIAEIPKAEVIEKSGTLWDSNLLPTITVDKLAKMNLAALKKKNSQVEGWIFIPGTRVNYPFVYGNDNEYYLTHTWDKKYNWMGAIFMDVRGKADFSDFNTIIYGHNLKNTEMFSGLLKYGKQDYFDEHKYMYIITESKIERYEAFAAYEADVNGHVFAFAPETKNNKRRFIDKSEEQSEVVGETSPKTDDKLITLSTCTGTGHATRWVVQFVLVE